MKIPIRQACKWIDPILIANAMVNEWGEEGLVWLDGNGSDLGRWATLGINPINLLIIIFYQRG